MNFMACWQLGVIDSHHADRVTCRTLSDFSTECV